MEATVPGANEPMPSAPTSDFFDSLLAPIDAAKHAAAPPAATPPVAPSTVTAESKVQEGDSALFNDLLAQVAAPKDSDSTGATTLPKAPNPPKLTIKPKIDFAALRKAQKSDVGQANQKVGKLFGADAGPESAQPMIEPPATNPFQTFAPRSAPVVVKDHWSKRLRCVVEHWTDALAQRNPLLPLLVSYAGLLMVANGLLLIVLASLGWI